jgi:hypothetical protein
MNFHNKIKETFEIRYNQIPKPYISVHVRNTDIRTADIEQFLNKNTELIKNKNIFLASDDCSIINLFKERYDNVYSFSYLVETTQCGLHQIKRTTKDQIQYNIDTIVDLLLLANGDEYIYSCYCGFSKLAEYMFKNKNMNNISYERLIL